MIAAASTIAVVLFIGGVQLLMLGIIGEYLGRVFDEVRQRPTYVVRSRLGFEAASDPVRLSAASDQESPAASPRA